MTLQIIDKKLNLQFELGHHQHCLIAQIPNHLKKSDSGHSVANPEKKWEMIISVLELVASGSGNLKKLHFLMFPESALPLSCFPLMIDFIDKNIRENSVVMFGVEHVTLKQYREILEHYSEDNEEAIALVDKDIDSGDVLSMPVNWCCIAVKETTGKLRVFLEAKSHPFRGEEFLDKNHDLYRGRHFYFFRSRPSCFNFMTLICLDYLYRDIYSSNIKKIIDHSNNLYFTTRQELDALFVIQCNPKPEHRSYREVLSGFYGEYLEDFPGVRETVTIFGNSSSETVIDDSTDKGFGFSYITINKNHKLAFTDQPEFRTDDFGSLPLCRLRFSDKTRLLYFNLPMFHETDPRTSRIPLKVHSVFRQNGNTWERISDIQGE